MFGVRKSFNLSFENENEVPDQPVNSRPSGGGSNYIYYNQSDVEDEQFINQIEIYIRPNNYPEKKILVMVKADVTFEQLYKQIEENFKSTPDFKTISNLKIKNFTMVFGDARIKLPLTGPISKYLKSGDLIYCDIISQEIWMTTYIKYEVNKYKNFKKTLKVEYKVQKRYNFLQIQIILLKAGLSLFYDLIKNEELLDGTLNYYLKNFTIFKKKKKTLSSSVSKEYIYESIVSMSFEIFEELIHEQLRLNQVDKSEPIYFRFDEYSNLQFEEILFSKKFEPELNTLKDISKEFLTSQYNDLKTTFIFYNPKNPEIIEDLIMPANDSVSTELDVNDVTEYNEIANFMSEDNDYSNVGDNRLMRTSSVSSNEVDSNNQYKADANMIIISNFLEFNKASYPRQNRINNRNNQNDLNPEIDEDKDIISVEDNLKINDNLKIKDNLIEPLTMRKTKTLAVQDDSINDDQESNDDQIDINKNIFFLDDDSNDKKRKRIKSKSKSKSKQNKTLKFKLLLLKEPDCCQDLYEFFQQRLLLEQIKKRFKCVFNKNLIERLKVPESRNLEAVDRNFYKFLLKKKKKKKKESTLKYHTNLIVFMAVLFLYFIFALIFVNTDFLKI